MDLLKVMLLYMSMLVGTAVNTSSATPIPYAELPTPVPIVTETPTPAPTITVTPDPTSTPTPRLVLMKEGSSGSAVRMLQARLKELGYTDEEPDGFYGPKTAKAVEAFQERNGLKADGIAGQQTLKKMFNDDTVLPALTPAPEG